MDNIKISSYMGFPLLSQSNLLEISLKNSCLMTGFELHYRYPTIVFIANLDLRSIMIVIRFFLMDKIIKRINQKNDERDLHFAEFNVRELNLFYDKSSFHSYIYPLKKIPRDQIISHISVLTGRKYLSINSGYYEC
jgi:hypothetical protein